MAAFVTPHIPGFAPGDPVPSAAMNLINTQLPKAPNFVDGAATYNPAGLIQIGGAGLQFNGPTAFASTSDTEFVSGSTTTLEGAFYVDGPGAVYLRTSGRIVVQNTGEIAIQSGGDLVVESGGGITWESGSLSQAESGATVQFASGSVLNVGGTLNFGGDSEIFGTLTVNSAATLALGSTTTLTGSQPSSSADPGANNRLAATNIVKAWAAVRFNAGTVTVLDGYNVASVSISVDTVGVVTLARAMANANYAITYGVGGTDHSRKYATTQDSGKTTTVFQFNVWSEADAAPVDFSDAGTDVIVSFCVMGRQ